jgi:hypothetical protein
MFLYKRSYQGKIQHGDNNKSYDSQKRMRKMSSGNERTETIAPSNNQVTYDTWNASFHKKKTTKNVGAPW